jgi:hypothetical protein
MPNKSQHERLKAILDELDEIARLDRSVIQPRNARGTEPLEAVPYEVLDEYGKRAKRREQLQEELRNASLENWAG